MNRIAMKRFGIIILTVIQTVVLIAQKDISNECVVRPIGKNMVLNGTQVLYALPKNIIRCELTLSVTEYKTGPYAGYAEKYLNITEGVIVSDQLLYEISDIELSRYSVLDSTQFFAISNINPFNLPLIQLNADGVILACNVTQPVEGYELEACSVKNMIESSEMPPFLDLGVKPFLYEKNETLYKTIKTDTVDTKVAYANVKMEATTTEMDAEAAANFIKKLRKRRFKLIVGQAGEVNAVEGPALELMIKEMDALEQAYLELFIGKELTFKQKYYFDFEPSSDALQEQKVLCWFSATDGISVQKTDARKANYQELVIGSSVMGAIQKPTIALVNNDGKNNESIKYGLYYRMPGNLALNIKVGQSILAQEQMQIAQKGVVIPLPANYLTDRRFAIYFYPELGAIKGIYQNKE